MGFNLERLKNIWVQTKLKTELFKHDPNSSTKDEPNPSREVQFKNRFKRRTLASKPWEGVGGSKTRTKVVGWRDILSVEKENVLKWTKWVKVRMEMESVAHFTVKELLRPQINGEALWSVSAEEKKKIKISSKHKIWLNTHDQKYNNYLTWLPVFSHVRVHPGTDRDVPFIITTDITCWRTVRI